MPDKYFFILGIFYVLCISDPGSGQNWTYLGQLAGWISSTHADLNHTGLGLRYLPTLEPVFVLSAHHTLDLELSLNASYRVDLQGCDTKDTNHKIEPCRLWIRYYSEQYESRLGLQKISFGSAVFFRLLMWFDNLDPRDPLQVTRGVYALLSRYYFLTNANVWV